jgi:acetylglutamate kinase
MHVLKIGGNELDKPGFLSGLAEAVATTSEPVLIIHGGGRAIADMQAQLGLETIKVDGLRVTDANSLTVVEMVLSGQVNKKIVSALLAAGVDAIGISGVDRGLLRCKKMQHPTADLGYVGEIVEVRTEVITQLLENGITPVISPISLGLDGQTYNVNADDAACAVASALGAKLLDFVSNVPGVLHDGHVLPALKAFQVESLIGSGVICDGMVPKVRAALAAVNRGVPCARIIDLTGLATAGGTSFSR